MMTFHLIYVLRKYI